MRRSLLHPFRLLLVAGGALASLAALAAPARAQQIACSANQDVKIEIGVVDDVDDTNSFDPLNQNELVEFFNEANCLCQTPVALRLGLNTNANLLDSDPADVYLGTNCLSPEIDNRTQCEQVTTFGGNAIAFSDVTADLRTQTIQVFNAAQLITMEPSGVPSAALQDACLSVSEGRREIYFRVDPTGNEDDFDNTCDLSVSLQQASLAEELFVDPVPPPAPVNPDVDAGEAGARVTWEVPLNNQDDLRSFQVLCERNDGTRDPADNLPRAAAGFQAPRDVCPELFPAARRSGRAGEQADAGPPIADGGPDGRPGADAGSNAPIDLSSADVCSPEIAANAEEYRVTGLQNGVEYRITLVSIDPARNATAVDLGTVTPRAVTDFWEDYQNQGGAADGGYCFVATAAYGSYDHPYVRVLRDLRDESLASTGLGRWLIDVYYESSPPLAGFIERHESAAFVSRVLLFPVVVAAGLWVYSGALGKLALFAALALAWSWRRMRKQRRREAAAPRPGLRRAAIAAGSAAVVLLAWQGLASAQPYWDEVVPERDRRAPDRKSAWMVELKTGPYTPSIDDEFDAPMGPYEQMFGDDTQWVGQLEVDRFFLYPAGQLGVGLGLGWFSTTARAFEQGEDGQPRTDSDGNPVRSAGDETTLSLIPTYLVAVYRLTALDDRYGIPVVPYGKAGLSYYIWRVSRPDDETAVVPTDPTCTGADCEQNEGRGGTLGYQATVGVSIRAERLDPRSAANMRTQLGIEHAGFFAEMTMAKVDGFGSDDKLNVGDTSWLAGINFEF